MKTLWDWIKRGYLRLFEPVTAFLVRQGVHPNVITTIGTCCSIAGGVIYGFGHISIGGWFLGLTAFFDVVDGNVARRTGQTSVFGAFYDSTLDRVADAAVLSGLAVFYATSPQHANTALLVVTLAAIVGGFLVSYTRARAEALGVDAKVGLMQRPERVVLLSAPQAFFGLALNGWVLGTIVVVLAVSFWITAGQRVLAVYRATLPSSGLTIVPPKTFSRVTPPTPSPATSPAPAPRAALKSQ
jgi:CDP-diacylglycerol---glycerol-3-phosphate 3-phosphatidyltransferase